MEMERWRAIRGVPAPGWVSSRDCRVWPLTTPKTNMTMEKQLVEDVSPLKKHVIFQLLMLVFRGAIYKYIYKVGLKQGMLWMSHHLAKLEIFEKNKTHFQASFMYPNPPRVSNFSPKRSIFWWLRGSNFRPLEDSGMYDVAWNKCFNVFFQDYLWKGNTENTQDTMCASGNSHV